MLPRQGPLDAPGALHDVMIWGLAGERIVADGTERATFLAWLGAGAGARMPPALGLSTSGIAKAVARAETK